MISSGAIKRNTRANSWPRKAVAMAPEFLGS
ncbi:hypothetical protein DSM3645_03998 [Blastopirellula marina DSM 3645]|uniref:Uncharacterized protein n=1 Tax=Blastopirellula marina DSM 3645 TaxID=314230 RepID=A3ZV41_9BACT|nr:hypothetical protein DSM3645_03998 [Blastopirellula marina DSM 3645]